MGCRSWSFDLRYLLSRPPWDTEVTPPEEVHRLFTPAFTVEREEGGEDPSGPRSAWYWLRKLCPAVA